MTDTSQSEEGMTLTDALKRFSDPETWSDFCASRQMVSGHKKIVDGLSPGEPLDSYLNRRSEDLRSWRQGKRQHEGLWQKLRRAFQDKLREGELSAYAFSLPRSPRDLDRVLVPADLWHDHAKIDWRQSSIAADGLAFVSVRIYRSEKGQPAAVDPYRTGLPGKPSIKHLILGEFCRRAEAGEIKPKLAQEATALHEWAASTHPKAPTPKVRSIENMIRSDYHKAGPLGHPK